MASFTPRPFYHLETNPGTVLNRKSPVDVGDRTVDSPVATPKLPQTSSDDNDNDYNNYLSVGLQLQLQATNWRTVVVRERITAVVLTTRDDSS